MNRKKMCELILYIAHRSRGDPNFGAVKLNKLLYFTDFRAFADLGHSVSGATYIKRPFGPVPRGVMSVLAELVADGLASIRIRNHFGRRQQRLVTPPEPPDLKELAPDEIAMVEEVLNECSSMNATEVSSRSHDGVGWQVAEDGEVIPYATVFLSGRQLTEEEMKQAREFAIERGWLAEAEA